MPVAAGLTVWLPLNGSLPLQAPLAEQEVALLDDQFSAALPPSVIAAGFTVIVTVVSVGGALANTLKLEDAVAGLNAGAPLKVAVNRFMPPCEGVSEQLASPFASVVPVQLAPPRVKFTTPPPRAVAGFSDTSVKDAMTVTGTLTVPPVGLGLSVRKDVCGPVFQVTRAWLEVSVVAVVLAPELLPDDEDEPLSVVVATTVSVPAFTAV